MTIPGSRSQVDRYNFANHWMEEIRTGMRYRRRYSHSKHWKDYRKYYRGDYKDDVIPVNRVFSFGRSLVPEVYFQNPRVLVTAKRPDLVLHARVVEAIDNHLIQEAMLKGTLKTSVLSGYINGIAPIKLGFDSEYGFLPEQISDVDSGTATQFGRKERRLIEYEVGVKSGMPWALPEFPENVIIPAGYRFATGLPWIAHRILRPLEDVKQDQKYKHTKELVGGRRMELTDTMQQIPLFFDGEKQTFCELYEIRDTRNQMIYVICENEVLLSARDVLQIEGVPWEFLIFNEDPEHFWGIPDVSIIEPQQLEYNEIRTQTRKHRQIALLKFLYLKGAIKKDQLEHFLSGEVGPAVGIDAESLANAISVLQPHIPPDLRAEAMHVLEDMRESIGYSENAVGAFAQGTPPSALETQRVGQSSDRRILERRDIVGDVLVNIVRKWNQYIFSFWTGEKVIQIAGPDGVQQWVKYTGDQLRGEYSLRIDASSGLPITQEVRLQSAATLLKAFGGDQMVDQPTIKGKFLEQYEWIFPGITHALKMMPPQAAMLSSLARQQHPMMGGGSGAARGMQRGGGQRPGGSAEKPIDFEQMKRRFEQA